MSELSHCLFALLSGIALETIYALNVIFIGKRRNIGGGVSAVLWGFFFLIGVNESFKTNVAAGLWCVGLGIGTVFGMRLAPEEKA